MNTTIQTPCLVPWKISPTASAVTLLHTETDVAPECTVLVGAGRLRDDGKVDLRRIEITFDSCYFTRGGPHGDTEGIEALGYEVDPRRETIDVERFSSAWQASGFCPDSGFYVAKRSSWLQSVPQIYRSGARHYVVDGRDGYVELIARGFRWRERVYTRDWTIMSGDLAFDGAILGEGEGVE
jgi:hypothetical protein